MEPRAEFAKEPKPGRPRGARARPRWMRSIYANVIAGAGVPAFLLLLFGCAMPFFLQDSMMYFPRKYPGDPPAAENPAPPWFAYTTADGVRQWGYRVDPPAGAPEPPAEAPGAWLVFYGNATLAVEMADVFEPAVREIGCTVYIVDYRGYGFNEGRPNEKNLTNDALGAYDSLEAEGAFENGVGVIGHSMGAAVGLALAGARPVDRLLLVSPFTSVRELAREYLPLPLAVVARNDWPNKDRLQALLNRPESERPASIGLMHGARDEIIPVSMGRDLAALAPDTIQLKVYDSAMHNDIFAWCEDELAAFMKDGHW